MKKLFTVAGKQLMFAQPWEVNAPMATALPGRVVVMDVAFNGGHPGATATEAEAEFVASTQAFIDTLGERLIWWLDHHPNPRSLGRAAADSRFLIYQRDVAPACPVMIDAGLAAKEYDTLLTHVDFDGVMSAAKLLRGGIEPYPGADADAVAADTRRGTISARGMRYEEALKADILRDDVKAAIVTELVSGRTLPLVDEAVVAYQPVKAETQRLAQLYQERGWARVVDARGAAQYDLTALLMAGQTDDRVAFCIRDDAVSGVAMDASANGQVWNLLRLFDTTVGMPSRLPLAYHQLEEVIGLVNAHPGGNVKE